MAVQDFDTGFLFYMYFFCRASEYTNYHLQNCRNGMQQSSILQNELYIHKQNKRYTGNPNLIQKENFQKGQATGKDGWKPTNRLYSTTHTVRLRAKK